MKYLFSLLLSAVMCFGGFVFGQAPEDPAHDELRMLRTQVIDAIVQGDIDAVLTHVHPNVVVTWQNADVCRGAGELKAFFERMGKKTFQGYKVPPTPDDLTVLYGGDTGVAFGRVVGQYTLFGKEFEFTSRWTATVVKESGKWLLASYHVSFNALDNPLLNAAEKSLIWVAAGTALLGALIGFFLGKRKRT